MLLYETIPSTLCTAVEKLRSFTCSAPFAMFRASLSSHSIGTVESASVYASKSNVHASSSSGRNVTLAVIRALATPSTCVPHGVVSLSMATTHHMKLRPVQFARVAHLDCFLSRLVSVCYGFTDAYGQCVYGSCDKTLGLANPCLPSDYRRSQYVALNWAKWCASRAANRMSVAHASPHYPLTSVGDARCARRPLFIDTLRVARSALWLEADVVILSNPWELLLSQSEAFATVQHSVRYQYETPPCTIESLVQSRAVSCAKSSWPGASSP